MVKRILLAALLAAALWPQSAHAASITLNQPNPYHGDTINFTTQGGPAKQYVNLICRQNGNIIYAWTNAYWGTFTRDFTLSSEPDGTGNGYGWTGGAATCRAGIWNFGTGNPHELAGITFEVAA